MDTPLDSLLHHAVERGAQHVAETITGLRTEVDALRRQAALSAPVAGMTRLSVAHEVRLVDPFTLPASMSEVASLTVEAPDWASAGILTVHGYVLTTGSSGQVMVQMPGITSNALQLHETWAVLAGIGGGNIAGTATTSAMYQMPTDGRPRTITTRLRATGSATAGAGTARLTVSTTWIG